MNPLKTYRRAVNIAQETLRQRLAVSVAIWKASLCATSAEGAEILCKESEAIRDAATQAWEDTEAEAYAHAIQRLEELQEAARIEFTCTVDESWEQLEVASNCKVEQVIAPTPKF